MTHLVSSMLNNQPSSNWISLHVFFHVLFRVIFVVVIMHLVYG
jgi:hypothetical protein